VKNIEIRNLIKQKRLKHYEVAEAIGISEYTLSKWLHSEMTAERKEKVLQAIESIKV
jgi:transcriptional regulator with XRE-family HTH domain